MCDVGHMKNIQWQVRWAHLLVIRLAPRAVTSVAPRLPASRGTGPCAVAPLTVSVVEGTLEGFSFVVVVAANSSHFHAWEEPLQPAAPGREILVVTMDHGARVGPVATREKLLLPKTFRDIRHDRHAVMSNPYLYILKNDTFLRGTNNRMALYIDIIYNKYNSISTSYSSSTVLTRVADGHHSSALRGGTRVLWYLTKKKVLCWDPS